MRCALPAQRTRRSAPPSLNRITRLPRSQHRVGAASAAPTCFALCSVEAMETSRIRDGIRAGLPLALAPLLFGASFGLLAVEAGMGWARCDRDVRDDVRRLGAVRSRVDPRRRRRRARRDRRRDPAQRPLRAAEPGGRVDLSRLPAAALPRVAADRGRVVGALRPHRVASTTRSSPVSASSSTSSGSAAPRSARSSAICSTPRRSASTRRSRRSSSRCSRRTSGRAARSSTALVAARDHARAPAVRAAGRADRRRQLRRADRAATVTWVVIAVVGARDDGLQGVGAGPARPARAAAARRLRRRGARAGDAGGAGRHADGRRRPRDRDRRAACRRHRRRASRSGCARRSSSSCSSPARLPP